MSSIDDRIAQFEHMAREDPDNEMAHFSLGSQYLKADRFADAARSFGRCIELNPEMSKAYELAGRALIADGDRTAAAEILRTGYTVAASRGDVLPRDAIAESLAELDEPLPEVDLADAPADEAAGNFVCQRTGRAGNQLPDPPLRGPLGQWIFENISQETWNDWIGQGTKVINELRLDFSRDEDQAVYDQHMCEFLGLEPEEYQRLLASSDSASASS